MGKHKIQPILIIAMAVNACSLWLLGLSNLEGDHKNIGLIFITVSIFFAIFGIYGLINNKKYAKKRAFNEQND